MIKEIDVITKMTASNGIIPLFVEWENGMKFEIDKVIEISRRASLKGGGSGLRYTCIIKGKTKYLFLDDYVWKVEI